jgi:NAD-dependent SIR2 family protein deacetylase
MKIALDYDLTYSADPEFWDAFIVLAYKWGHDLRIVTVRDDRLDRRAPLVKLEKKIRVIYTRGVAKKWYCSHFTNGFVPDIWIDDKPESILNNSSATPEFLVGWRQELHTSEGPVIPL